MLKHNGKYSQGRVYLLWSIIGMYIALTTLMYTGIIGKEVNIATFKMVIDALEYCMTLFGGYVFGGKFVDVIKTIRNKKEENEKSDSL
jgi:hypothetical protein